jgi:hypothetical protein
MCFDQSRKGGRGRERDNSRGSGWEEEDVVGGREGGREKALRGEEDGLGREM